MADEVLKPDANNKFVAGAITDDSNQYIKMLRIDDTTKGLKVMIVGGTGAGTVTSVTAGTGLTATASNPITDSGTIALNSKLSPLDTLGTANQQIRVNAGATALEYFTPSAGTGTVTSVSVTTANGVSGSVATATTTPAITITLGAITPTTVNGNTFTTGSYTLTGTAGKTLNFTNTLTLSGTDSTTMTFPTTSKTLLANDLSNVGTAVANLIFTDNTYDIGASGATRPRTGYFATSIVSPVVNATTGVQINGAATSNKILKGNGTNFVASTETYAAPGTTGNVMTSDGTNWTSAAPATSGSSTAIDSAQSVYSNFQITFSGSAATPTGDTFQASSMGAGTAWNGNLLRASFGTNSYISQFLQGNIGASSNFCQFGNGKDIIISFNANFGSISNDCGIGISDNTDCFYDVTQSGGKMLFRYTGSILYATSGEATTNTSTDVTSGITATNWNAYKIVYTYGTDVKFYINNTLVATHASNRPTSSNNARFGVGGKASGDTAAISSVVISIEK